MTDDDRFRWAEALEIERIHGDDGPRWIAERMGRLALVGDADGIARYREIALRYASLLGTRRQGPQGRAHDREEGATPIRAERRGRH